MTQADFARLRGVSRQAVSKLCRGPGDAGRGAGSLHGTGALLPDGRINAELAEQLLGPAAAGAGGTGRQAADAAPSPGLPLGPSALGERILGDRARFDRAKADSAEMAARRERRELVLESAVADPQFDVARVMRNAVLAVPEQRAEELAATADPRAVQALLLDALDAALNSASAELARMQREAEEEADDLDAALDAGGEGE